MAVTTMDALIQALVAGEKRGWSKGSFGPLTTIGDFHSLWLTAGNPGAGAIPATGNGAVPDDSTAGAHPFVNAVGDNYLGQVAANGLQIGTLVIYDRLWANSGLNTTTSITSFTSAALTRFTDGVGVECWAEWHTASGASTATVATVVYTNQAGTGTRTGTISMGATAKIAGKMYPMVMQSGDYGIRAAASTTLSVTQTSGNWGLVFVKRLAEIPIRPSDQSASVLNAIDLGLPAIPDDACIAFQFQGATAANTLTGSLTIAKG